MTKTLDDLKREVVFKLDDQYENDGYAHPGFGWSIGAEDAIDHLHAQGRIVPDGYVAVPLEPTDEMLYASKHAMENILKNMGDEERKQRYGEPKKGIGYVVKWKEKHAIRYKAMIAAVGVEKCQKR